MERKRKNQGDFQLGQNDSFEEEEVFDHPRVETDGETETVSKDAYFALNEAFKTVKRRYLEEQKQNRELKSSLKQRNRKGSHGQVYQERDDLKDKLEKSYLAFKEKYNENEQLKKKVAELSQGSDQENTSVQSEAGAISASASEEDKKSEEGKYQVVVKLLENIGLEIIEDGDQFFIVLTDRDKLKIWIQESSDGNISVEFERCVLQDKATETAGTLATQEDRERVNTQRTEVDARVILLKQKIEDQGQELARFYKILRNIMGQREKVNSQIEQGSEEARSVERVDLTNTTEAASERTGDTGAATVVKRDVIHQKAALGMLEKVRGHTAEMHQVKDHLDKQHVTLCTLVDLTKKATTGLARGLAATNRGAIGGLGAASLPKAEMAAACRRQRHEDEDFERLLAVDAPLSLPVQETEEHRIRRIGEPFPDSEEAIAESPEENRNLLSPASPPTVPTRGAEGGAVSMATAASQPAWTGESDIEVIDDEEEDAIAGATSFQGRICPMCDKFFPGRVSQVEFEFHVQQHFEESVD